MAIIFLPYALRKYADGAERVDVSAKTLGELIDNLEAAYPGTAHHLVEEGRLKPGLAAIVGHMATRRGLLQKLEPDTEVHFITAISGGSFPNVLCPNSPCRCDISQWLPE